VGFINKKYDFYFLSDILANSLYYSACETDGGVVKDCNTFNRDLGIKSFIYTNYDLGGDTLNQELNNFYGYTVFAKRNILEPELIPYGWNVTLPPGLTPQEYLNLVLLSYKIV
jgi:hypothetical protein